MPCHQYMMIICTVFFLSGHLFCRFDKWVIKRLEASAVVFTAFFGVNLSRTATNLWSSRKGSAYSVAARTTTLFYQTAVKKDGGQPPCGSHVYMHVMNKIAMGARGKLLPRSNNPMQWISALVLIQPSGRQRLVGGEGMAHWKGERTARCKEKELPFFSFGTCSELTNQPTPCHHPTWTPFIIVETVKHLSLSL